MLEIGAHDVPVANVHTGVDCNLLSVDDASSTLRVCKLAEDILMKFKILG